MNIAVIGGTRGTGSHVVEQALEAGHAVTLLARRPESLSVPDNLRVVGGDILDLESVLETVSGVNAVVVSIGIPPTRHPVTVFSEGVRCVISAMEKSGIRRLVTVSGIGAGDSRGHGGFFYDRILNPLLLKTNYADKDRMEEIVRITDLDWTIVRPGFLTNGPRSGLYQVLTDMTGVRCGRISRADTAAFILGELENPRHIHETVLLTT